MEFGIAFLLDGNISIGAPGAGKRLPRSLRREVSKKFSMFPNRRQYKIPGRRSREIDIRLKCFADAETTFFMYCLIILMYYMSRSAVAQVLKKCKKNLNLSAHTASQSRPPLLYMRKKNAIRAGVVLWK
jgi:hypothetical protein